MMISPGGLKLVREFLNGLNPLRSQDKKPGCCCTDPANQKKKPLHFIVSDVHWAFGCSMAATGSLAIALRTVYTFDMDSVRFGRALGLGARNAAKALVMAADAASAPSPAGKRASAPYPGSKRGESMAGSSIHAAAQTAAKARATREGLARGGKRFGEAVWGPFARLSGALWLELTGVFFGLFLLTAVISAWKLRGSLHATGLNHTEHQRLLWSIAMALVFGYFSVSSFVRAALRERRRG